MTSAARIVFALSLVPAIGSSAPAQDAAKPAAPKSAAQPKGVDPVLATVNG